MFEINWPDILAKFRYQILFLLIGLILIGGGILSSKLSFFQPPKVEVLDNQTSSNNPPEIVVEIEGAVEKPGVYHLPFGSRIEDLLVSANGLSANADRNWVDKTLNRAAKLSDGQKLYIPKSDEQTNVLSANNSNTGSTVSNNINQNSSKLININESSASELDTLSGIGPVYAQKIIDNRPYSTIEELVNKKVISQKVFDNIKDKISVY